MRIEKLKNLVRPYYETNSDPSHDWSHILRVVSTAQLLASKEKAILDIVSAGALCHDLINLPKDHPESKMSSSLSAKEAHTPLKECGFSDEEITQIQICIVQHSFSRGIKPTTLESAIVQDADRLDTLGSIGILRCATVCTKMNGQYYDPNDILSHHRPLDDKKFMLDHYFVKIFKLPDLMNTQAAKEEARLRVEFMQMFINELKREITLP
ncbi:MAG: HD domain-containing protein [Bacteriovoracaceae bacterium]